MMIHEGDTESGHYFSFIRDFSQNKYFKYNDFRVGETEDEEVEKCSRGGEGPMNAYCLIYVNEEIHQTLSDKFMKNYELQSELSEKSDYYNNLVSDELAALIIQENLELRQNIKEAKVADECKKIMDLYEARIKIVEDFYEKNKPLKYNFASIILMFYHQTKNQKEDKSHLGRWLLLNMCYKEKQGIDKDLADLEENNELRIKLEQAILKNKERNPKAIVPNAEDLAFIREKSEGFAEYFSTIIITIDVLNDINTFKYKSVFGKILRRKTEIEDFRKMIFMRDAGRTLILKLTSEINRLIIKGESYEKEIVPIFNILAFAFKNLYTDLEDLHYKQVLYNLRCTLEIAGEKLGEHKESFETYLNLFEGNDLESIDSEEEKLTEYSKDTKALLEKVRKHDQINKWRDVYKENNILHVFTNHIGKSIKFFKFLLILSFIDEFNKSMEFLYKT